jgi:integration host factor subunit beta
MSDDSTALALTVICHCRRSRRHLSLNPMTRSDLVEELANRFGQLTQRDAEYAVKTILDAMGEALVRGHRIEIRGFGSFSINHRPPRMGRNPRSGEAVAIPEKRVPHFKPGKALREAVDERTKQLLGQHDT